MVIPLVSAILLAGGILYFRWFGDDTPRFMGTIFVILIGVVSAPMVGVPVGWVAWKIINRQPKPPTGRAVTWDDHEWVIRRYDATMAVNSLQNAASGTKEVKDGRRYQFHNSDPNFKSEISPV